MKKVVIIGAGPAGLTAGYELLRQSKKYDILIIEETKEIGGISKTVNYNNIFVLRNHSFFARMSLFVGEYCLYSQ